MAFQIRRPSATAASPSPAKEKPASARLRAGIGVQKIKKPAKGKKQFVLFVGDEGAILVYMDGAAVAKRVYSPSPDNIENMSALLKSDPKAPITVLLDSLDQSYSRHTFPPVAKISLNNIVKRRIQRDFPNEEMTGALPIGREKTGRKDWLFLLVVVQQSDAFKAWMNLCLSHDNPFSGLYLSPIEGELYLKHLAEALKDASPAYERTEVNSDGSQWQFLVSHHKVGGFRQIVLRDGNLVFTRMAQPLNDSEPAVIAGSMEQEMLNTVEYLKRVGLEDNPKLQTIIICSQDIRKSIEAKHIPAQKVYILTPYETAEAIGHSGIAMPEDHYGDILMASSFILRKKRRLKFNTKLGNKIAQLVALKAGLRGFAVLAGIIGIGYTGYAGLDAIKAMEEISSIKRQHAAAKAEVEDLQKKIEVYPKTLDKILDVSKTYEALASKVDYSPETFMVDFLVTGGGHITIDSYDWARSSLRDENSGSVKETISITTKINIPRLPEETTDAYKTRAKNVLRDIETQIKEYDVTMNGVPSFLRDNEALQTGFGSAADNTIDKTDNIPVEVKFTAPKTAPADGMNPMGEP